MNGLRKCTNRELYSAIKKEETNVFQKMNGNGEHNAKGKKTHLESLGSNAFSNWATKCEKDGEIP